MSGDDLCLWPDGTVCLAEDLDEMLVFMSDDYERVAFDTSRWWTLAVAEGYAEQQENKQ